MSDEGGPDLEEAKALMRDLANKRVTRHDPKAVAAAWFAVRDALLSLNGYAGVSITLSDDGREIHIFHDYGKGYVVHDSMGIMWTHKPDEENRLPIVFDVESKSYVSTEPDEYRVPVPGQAIPRRSVIATILAAVLANFPEDSRKAPYR